MLIDSIKPCFILALAITVSLFSGELVTAQVTKKTKLPTGEQVLQKHIAASGKQAAFDKIKNRYFKSTIEIKGAGITLNAETYATKPNKVISTIKADAIGTITKGCNGQAAWSMSEMQGPVVESGAALENQLRDSTFDRLIYWKRAYESAKCVSIEKVNSKECYKVVLTPHPYKSKNASRMKRSLLTAYFDKNTFLVSKIESTVVSDAGSIDVTAYLSDYKTVDGIKIAHRTELNLVGQKRVIQIQSMKHNVKLADNQFTPPAEIQKLLKKSKVKR